MSKKAVKRALLCCEALAILFVLTGASPRAMPAKATIVMVERAEGHTVYKVDSKPVGHRPTDDILHAFNEVSHQNGADHPVLVYLDSRVPIEEIWNLGGIAGKAQLNNLRYFVFFRETQTMVEIKWTPPTPFTTSPAPNE